MMWKWKRPAAFLLAAAMIFTMPGVPASAVEAGASAVHTGLCEHHPEHTEDCGYTKGTEGADCEYEHTEDCYTLVKKCVHEHDESCYPVLEESISENTATPSEAEKAQPTACTHECSEESGCITKELNCQYDSESTPITAKALMKNKAIATRSNARKVSSIARAQETVSYTHLTLPTIA